MAHVHNSKNMASGMMKEMMAPGKMQPGMMKGMMGSEMMKGMMESGMMKEMMGPGDMMGSEMMQGMMGPGGMMGHGMGKEAAKGTVKVVVATAGRQARHGFFGRLVRNPVVLLGTGIVAGYLIHKYRKEILTEKE